VDIREEDTFMNASSSNNNNKHEKDVYSNILSTSEFNNTHNETF